jgi:hypothetical protein
VAKEPKTIIILPELNKPSDTGNGIDKAQLELSTTNYNGRITSVAHVVYTNPEGNLTFATDDYLKRLATLTGARATQKTLDTRHAAIFTPEAIETIKGDAFAFYRAKHSKWIDSVLSNDEASTDEELLALFLSNGVPEGIAKGSIANRTMYLNATPAA